jgi:polysaccharide export outer membrane protein
MKVIRLAALLPILLLVICLFPAMVESQDAPAADQPQPAESPSAVEGPPPGYRLQPDDIMRVSVFGEPELTTEQVVDPQGFINMQFGGQIHAEGLTLDELIAAIEKGLSEILVEPKVQVSLTFFHRPKVYVLGQVTRPGLHEFKVGNKIMEAIAQAGSFTEAAALEKATLTHKDLQEQLPLDLKRLFYDGDMSQNLPLQDGDTIYIPEDTKNKYFVLGEVNRPGMFRLKGDETVMEAISSAGGINQRGSLKGTCIIRGDLKNPQRIKLDVGKLLKSADMSQNIMLQPGDVVYVPETSKPDWNKIASFISTIVNSSYLLRLWGLN